MKREKVPKTALYTQISTKTGIDIKVIDSIIEALKDSVIENANKGLDTKITGFIDFELVKVYPRKGKNPKTGEEIRIEGRYVINPKVSQTVQDKINLGKE